MKKLILFALAVSCFAQEIKRPSKDTDFGVQHCVGTRLGSPSMAKAHDGAGLSTFSEMDAAGGQSTTYFVARNFGSWAPAGSSYSSLTLNVNSSSAGYLASGGGAGQACLYYSINAGVTYTKIRCDADVGGAGWAQVTDTISLTATQDLKQIQIEACAEGFRGSPGGNPGGFDNITIWDIWSSGTTTPQAGGNGSGTGEPHRAIIVVN